jgi:hypothetical protein
MTLHNTDQFVRAGSRDEQRSRCGNRSFNQIDPDFRFWPDAMRQP